jgi:hypothetical protein
MRMEHWWFTARLRLRSILRRNRVEQELDEELQFHLEHKIEEGITHGLPQKRRATRRCAQWTGWNNAKRRCETCDAFIG